MLSQTGRKKKSRKKSVRCTPCFLNYKDTRGHSQLTNIPQIGHSQFLALLWKSYGKWSKVMKRTLLKKQFSYSKSFKPLKKTKFWKAKCFTIKQYLQGVKGLKRIPKKASTSSRVYHCIILHRPHLTLRVSKSTMRFSSRERQKYHSL